MSDIGMADRKTAGSTLSTAFAPLTAAAMRGQYELLLAEAERVVENLFPGVTARALVHTGGAWHEAPCLEHGPDDALLTVPDGIGRGDALQRLDAGLFVPVTPGALGLWVIGAAEGELQRTDALALLRQFLAIAVQTCERQRIATRNLDEVQSMQRVATRILKSHDLGEILLLITQEAKRLLSSDICGVLLHEGEGLVMRRCVGNRSPGTANLHIGPGQGLAGRVLEHSKPASVEDYMASDTISRDFFHLAEAELVRSALAAPLLGRGGMIGVLEVWRRRPSLFTPQDTMRLVALANLTTIAIENAELYARQQHMVDELGRANAALNERYDMIRSVSALSHSMMQMLLQGSSLQALVTTASTFLDDEVMILALDGTTIAHACDSASIVALAPRLQALSPVCGDMRRLEVGEVPWRCQPVLVEGEATAWALSRVGPRGEALTELALVQLATLAALHRLEQRAASRARAESIDAIVWDLLRADEAARAAAIDRAVELKLDVCGPLRVVLVELGPTPAGSTERSGSAMRQLVARELDADGLGLRAVALQGMSIALLMADHRLDDAERHAQRAAIRLSKLLENRRVVAGMSSTCVRPQGLATAYREALIALDVARQIGRSGAVVYDRAGVVGLLLSLRHEVGMRRFLELNLGKLLSEEDRQRELLLHTLRVYFDVNCSHEAASQQLGVHRKTIAHRLARIADLTGLDLSTHDDRLVADLSLYVHRLLESQKPPAATP